MKSEFNKLPHTMNVPDAKIQSDMSTATIHSYAHTSTSPNTGGHRIISLDLLRGIIMIWMTLDHVRYYFHVGSFFADPTDLETTTTFIFLTRWITHFCAPCFVLLAGISANLFEQKVNSKQSLSRFLLNRGLWLIALEWIILTLAWTFDITYSLSIVQVIWVIGISMIVLTGIIYLPKWGIAVIAGALIIGHHLLDGIALRGNMWIDIPLTLLHQQKLWMFTENWGLLISYPLLPWPGIMMLGYVIGDFYHKKVNSEKRKRNLRNIGWVMIIGFVILRWANIYGDPNPWEIQDSTAFTFLSFINLTKYPASLLYCLMTIGPALLFLAAAENLKASWTDKIVVFGRVPLFFYIIHLYVIHALAIIGVLAFGWSWDKMILGLDAFTNASLLEYGYPMWLVYVLWLAILCILYPLCRWYADYKRENKHLWWLKYF